MLTHYAFSRGNGAAGTWRPVQYDGKWTARAWCPRCGISAVLDDHEIAADGSVTPSLVCPGFACDFHAFAELVGWDACDCG